MTGEDEDGHAASACAGADWRYEAMYSRTFASVSGQSRRGRRLAVPLSSWTSLQSPSASRPNVLSAMR